ncbi:MAG: hypothetical protein ACI4UM_09040 [Succinivibrio sp.]
MLKKFISLCSVSLAAMVFTGCTYSHVKSANTSASNDVGEVCIVKLPNTSRHPVNTLIQDNIVAGFDSLGISSKLIPDLDRAYSNNCSYAMKYSVRGGQKDKIGYIHIRFYNIGTDGQIIPNGEISHRQPVYVSKPEQRQQKITQLLSQMLGR